MQTPDAISHVSDNGDTHITVNIVVVVSDLLRLVDGLLNQKASLSLQVPLEDDSYVCKLEGSPNLPTATVNYKTETSHVRFEVQPQGCSTSQHVPDSCDLTAECDKGTTELLSGKLDVKNDAKDRAKHKEQRVIHYNIPLNDDFEVLKPHLVSVLETCNKRANESDQWKIASLHHRAADSSHVQAACVDGMRRRSARIKRLNNEPVVTPSETIKSKKQNNTVAVCRSSNGIGIVTSDSISNVSERDERCVSTDKKCLPLDAVDDEDEGSNLHCNERKAAALSQSDTTVSTAFPDVSAQYSYVSSDLTCIVKEEPYTDDELDQPMPSICSRENSLDADGFTTDEYPHSDNGNGHIEPPSCILNEDCQTYWKHCEMPLCTVKTEMSLETSSVADANQLVYSAPDAMTATLMRQESGTTHIANVFETFSYVTSDVQNISSPSPSELNSTHQWLEQSGVKSENETTQERDHELVESSLPSSCEKTEEKPQTRRKRGASERSFPCQYCGKIFPQKFQCTLHERCHTGEKPYSCRYCEKTFSCSSSRIVHERIHTGDKPYSCAYCGKKFTQRMSCKIHERIHTGEKAYWCVFCEKEFAHKRNCINHERSHLQVKPYSCSYCGKSFTRKDNCQVHERCHTGDKRFACTHCDRRFFSKAECLIHERKHTGEKPFSCDYCDKKFARKKTCVGHQKNHEKKGDRLKNR